MKKHIIGVLLFLSIVIPCADIKTGWGVVGNKALELGLFLSEGGAYVFCGLKLGEAIKQRNVRSFYSSDCPSKGPSDGPSDCPSAVRSKSSHIVGIGIGCLGYRLYRVLSNVPQVVNNTNLKALDPELSYLTRGLTIILSGILIKNI